MNRKEREEMFGIRYSETAPDEATEQKISDALAASRTKNVYDEKTGLWIEHKGKPFCPRDFMPPKLQLLLDSYDSGKLIHIKYEEVKKHNFTPQVIDGTYYGFNRGSCLYEVCDTGLCDYDTLSYTKEKPLIIGDKKRQKKVLKFFEDNNMITTEKEHLNHYSKKSTQHGGYTSQWISKDGKKTHTHTQFFGPQSDDGTIWVHTHKVHGYNGCDGIGEFEGPYHISCSKCKTELRLWEWGVDYDVG